MPRSDVVTETCDQDPGRPSWPAHTSQQLRESLHLLANRICLCAMDSGRCVWLSLFQMGFLNFLSLICWGMLSVSDKLSYRDNTKSRVNLPKIRLATRPSNYTLYWSLNFCRLIKSPSGKLFWNEFFCVVWSRGCGLFFSHMLFQYICWRLSLPY